MAASREEVYERVKEVLTEQLGVEILLERRFLCDVVFLDPELLGQDFLDPLEDFLARRCHVTSLRWGA